MSAQVAIIDIQMGNYASVRQAFANVGLPSVFATRPDDLEGKKIVVVPGVGAFGEAMRRLRANGLDAALKNKVEEGVLIVGICLGMQLLFSESDEFGIHEGLDVIKGKVVRLVESEKSADWGTVKNKVPQIGWNSVHRIETGRSFEGSMLSGVPDGAEFYFMHSYYVVPADPDIGLSMTRYGDLTYLSSIDAGNIKAFQFHPERSGEMGQVVYGNFARWLKTV